MKSIHDPAHRGVAAVASSSGALFGFDTTVVRRITHALRLAPREVFFTLSHPSRSAALRRAVSHIARRTRRFTAAAETPPATCCVSSACRASSRRRGCFAQTLRSPRIDVTRIDIGASSSARSDVRRVNCGRGSSRHAPRFFASRYRGRPRPENSRLFLCDAGPKSSVLVCFNDNCSDRSAQSNPRRHGIPDFERARSPAPFDRSSRVRRPHPPAFCADTMAPQITAALFVVLKARRCARAHRRSAPRSIEGRRTAICESRNGAQGGTID